MVQCIKTQSTKLKTYEFWNKKKLSNWIQSNSDYTHQWNISQIELYWLVLSIPCTYCQYWHIDNIIWYHLFSHTAVLVNPPFSYWQMTLRFAGHEPSFHFFGVVQGFFRAPVLYVDQSTVFALHFVDFLYIITEIQISIQRSSSWATN